MGILAHLQQYNPLIINDVIQSRVCLESGISACSKYESRTLFGLQATPLANTPANGSKQGPRTKPKGSRTLLCAYGVTYLVRDFEEVLTISLLKYTPKRYNFLVFRYTLTNFGPKRCQSVSLLFHKLLLLHICDALFHEPIPCTSWFTEFHILLIILQGLCIVLQSFVAITN